MSIAESLHRLWMHLAAMTYVKLIRWVSVRSNPAHESDLASLLLPNTILPRGVGRAGGAAARR